jgi:multiple sugar transport system ATP-binding protein
MEAEGGTHWPLPATDGLADGQAVTYGVRPEHLTVGATDAPVPAEVIVVEPTGAETELLLKAGAAQVLAVCHGRSAARPGDRLGLGVELGAVHLFDPASGRALGAVRETGAA